MKVLLAEDDQNISTIAKIALEQLGGHSVDVASVGAQALELAMNNSYDVILLDEMMPKLNGLRVCEEYVQHKGYDTPVIFLSAKSQEKATRSHCEFITGLVIHSFVPTQLCSLIDQMLSKKGFSL